MRLTRGFSLVEMTVVLFIVALLLGSAVLTLSVQEERRAQAEAQRLLEAAVDAIIGFAITNRRLPCPAVGSGDESIATAEANGGGTCTTNFSGFLPARTIGFLPVDSQGFGLDPWSNRIRYAVATGLTGCTGSSSAPHFTSVDKLKANGISCRPNNLLVCQDATFAGIAEGSTPSCGGAANQVTGTEVVAFLVFSTGKNGSNPSSYGTQENANVNNNAAGSVFISREHGTVDTAKGPYDDVMIWVPAGVLYSKLIAAGVLP